MRGPAERTRDTQPTLGLRGGVFLLVAALLRWFWEGLDPSVTSSISSVSLTPILRINLVLVGWRLEEKQDIAMSTGDQYLCYQYVLG
ncbi:hypothetical protein DER44DRAFT_756314 [Fusarium oxysporum]|nr:hypothetical protein DER44DRAFT_756314 [Fusarium oxysporum]